MIDTTGGDAATHAICLTALAENVPVVSGALYRGGAIARVRRQGTPGDTPILDRTPLLGYTRIPPGANEDVIQPAIGCSGPIHNAPPATVLSGAALISEVALDTLTCRLDYPEEIIDIYRVLPNKPPLNRLGRLP